MEDIEALRRGASRWSMAGDKQLLDTLQSLHQTILSKCSEANDKLCEMVTVLDDASVHLQNVNNKFMALSNSQFIESRVYDDDITTDIDNSQHKEQQNPTPSSDPQSLLSSLRVVENFHEAVTILPDSESSSSDDETLSRVVLRPKDVYAGRPLPYIIGSHAWKTKWHAGVIQDESDTDSESAQSRGREQYSDSEPEHLPVRPAFTRDDISTPSSLSSSHLSAAPLSLSPADVANELARRLGAGGGQTDAPSGASPVETTTTRTVYRVEKPTTTTVFSDEPPPLPSESDEYSEPDDNSSFTTSKNTPYSNVHKVDNEDSEPEDIFAELKRKTKENKPYDDRRKVQSVADDLFGDVFGGFVQKPPSMSESTPAKRISTLSSEQLDHNDNPTEHSVEKDSGTKKPIGGISLFGTNKNNESIGAAILKRNQRNSSDESDDSCQNTVKRDDKARYDDNRHGIDDSCQTNVKHDDKSRIEDNREKNKAKDEENIHKEVDRGTSKEKDLINDLFAKTKEGKKNKSVVSKNAQVIGDVFAKRSEIVKNSKTHEVKETKKKVDLFNDNIFDDIDDIFTSKVNLKEPNKEKPTKSLFDDDNDLFNEIEIKTDVKESQNSNKKVVKSIFDSDDELFSKKVKIDETKQNTKEKKAYFGEKVTKTETDLIERKPIENPTTEIKYQTTSKTKAKSLFDSDDDEDDIFTKIKTSNEKTSETEKSENLDKNTLINAKTVKTVDKIDIFGDEDDVENIFTKKDVKIETPEVINDKLKHVKDKPLFNSPNLFDDDDDELIAGPSKSTKSNEINSKIIEKHDIIDENKVINTGVDKNFICDQGKELGKPEQKESLEKPSKDNKLIEVAESESNSIDDWDTEDKNSEEDINSVNLSFPKTTKGKYDTQESNIDKNMTKEQSIEPKDNKDRPDNENVTDYENIPKIEEFSNKGDNIKDSDTEQSTFDENFKKPDIFSDIIEKPNPSSSDKNETEQKISKTDIVTDVFNDVPPEFEKPKEPKKSKNVNALFDDDSDDETFFKKNDTLIDDSDKPELDFSPSVERVFSLFDEPPAIDVDFIQKVDSKRQIEKDNETVDKNVNFNEDNIFKPNTEKINKSIAESKNIQKQSTDDLDGTETNNESLETKKIGKLKPMNLNINVNTLLPGASPKKQQKSIEKSLEQADGQITSKCTEITSKSSDELININKKDENLEKPNTKLTKTDPSILDNKLSKERAKIQVKRRPSTRRARREAVKTSGIDFGEDSTDNSSSIDDHKDKTQKSEETPINITDKPTKTAVDNEIAKKNEIYFGEDSTDYSSSFDDHKDKTQKTNEVTKEDANIGQPTNIKDGEKTSIENEIVTIDTKHDEQNITHAKKSENFAENKNVKQKESPSTDVKSKLVYILHDEDIFTDRNPKESKTDVKTENAKPEQGSIKQESIKKTKILNIIDDDDDLFKLNSPKTSGIKTLGKVYSESDTRTDISKERESDEDIFEDIAKQITEQKANEQTKTGVLKTITTNKQKTSLFEDLSDSEEELFGKTKNKSLTKNENKNKPANNKNVPKPKSNSHNLFSSDSEEDLFYQRSKKKEVKRSITQEVEVIRSKTQEIEVKKNKEVKGSLFSDIEDDDLFGTTKQTEMDSKKSFANVTTKPSSTAAEPVYDDPLSVLGDDD